MESHHKCQLAELCRVCGCKLHRGVKAKGKPPKAEPTYLCSAYADSLLVAFDISVSTDQEEIHPQFFCTLCHKAMLRVQVAIKCKNQYKCQMQPYNWSTHTADTCKVQVHVLLVHVLNMMLCCRHVNHFTSMEHRLPQSQQRWYTHQQASWL